MTQHFKINEALLWNEAYLDAKNSGLTDVTLPMVEIFDTVEGEGTRAGYPTVFVRVFHCNLRCTWCDTVYSYAPYKPEFEASIEEICDRVREYGWQYVCLTGGEPLIHRHKSQLLIEGLAAIPEIRDIHIETNGAIDIRPFAKLRSEHRMLKEKVRFIVDYKLPNSGEFSRMIQDHFDALEAEDEVKFVIANDEDFQIAVAFVRTHKLKSTILFSPVWDTMPPDKLVAKILETKLPQIKLNLQIHKVIWDPNTRGV